jgi:hypothetical protein
MKIKATHLIGPALHYAVALAEGWKRVEDADFSRPLARISFEHDDYHGRVVSLQELAYSEWAFGGPILDREDISTIRLDDDYGVDDKGFTTDERIKVWGATRGQHSETGMYGPQGDNWGTVYSIDADEVVTGPTALVAALRLHVKLKVGDSIEIPEDLV